MSPFDTIKSAWTASAAVLSSPDARRTCAGTAGLVGGVCLVAAMMSGERGLLGAAVASWGLTWLAVRERTTVQAVTLEKPVPGEARDGEAKRPATLEALLDEAEEIIDANRVGAVEAIAVAELTAAGLAPGDDVLAGIRRGLDCPAAGLGGADYAAAASAYKAKLRRMVLALARKRLAPDEANPAPEHVRALSMENPHPWDIAAIRAAEQAGDDRLARAAAREQAVADGVMSREQADRENAVDPAKAGGA